VARIPLVEALVKDKFALCFIARMSVMSTSKPYPREFRDDVVSVARSGQAPLTQIAKDFGIWCCLLLDLVEGS